MALVFEDHSPPQVDRIWPWVCYNKIFIYPIFYLLKGDYMVRVQAEYMLRARDCLKKIN